MIKELYQLKIQYSFKLNRIKYAHFYLLKSFISRTIRLASMRSSNAFPTFLIATLALIEWSKAEHTTPYAP